MNIGHKDISAMRRRINYSLINRKSQKNRKRRKAQDPAQMTFTDFLDSSL